MVRGLWARVAYHQTPLPARRRLGPAARRRGGETHARPAAEKGTPLGGKCRLSPPLPVGDGTRCRRGLRPAVGPAGSAGVPRGRLSPLPASRCPPRGAWPRPRPTVDECLPAGPPPTRPGAGPTAGIFPRETAWGSNPGGGVKGWPGRKRHPRASHRRAASPRGAEQGGSSPRDCPPLSTPAPWCRQAWFAVLVGWEGAMAFW